MVGGGYCISLILSLNLHYFCISNLKFYLFPLLLHFAFLLPFLFSFHFKFYFFPVLAWFSFLILGIPSPSIISKVPISKWVDQKTTVHLHNGVLYKLLEKEILTKTRVPDTCFNHSVRLDSMVNVLWHHENLFCKLHLCLEKIFLISFF